MSESTTEMRPWYLRFARAVWNSVEFKLLLAWVTVIVVTLILDDQRTYLNRTGDSIEQILRSTVVLGFFTLGSAVIIISGGIDLSSGSVIALSSAVFGSLLIVLDYDGFKAGHLGNGTVAIAILGTLCVGALVGTLHAWMITAVGLPPFVATLATLVGLRSFARVLVNVVHQGKSQIDFPDAQLRPILKSVTNISLLFLVLAVVVWIVMSWSVIGRHLHAMGGNEQAAKLSGIRTDRLKWLAYVFGSVTASIVGIIWFADTGSANPDTTARGYELNAIASSVIGGCSLQGGVGTIPGVVLGCLFLRTIIDAVDNVVPLGSNLFEGMIVGVVVVMAVTFSQRTGPIAKKYFSNAIGWTAIPILGLVATMAVVLFFHKEEWYTPTRAVLFGCFVSCCLGVRAYIELRGQSKK